MKIWLDDERDPNNYGCNDYTWVKTAEQAIILLKTGKVTHIHLDHDLGTEKTGYDVAKFIEEGAIMGTLNRIDYMRCHSQNPVGKRAINLALKNAFFAWRNKNEVL